MMKKTEQRTFTMHPHLLFDVIRRQAGSIDQAIREGVMNAVDARATRIDLKISNDEIVLKDNGTGFKDREQIAACFDTFGQPHEESEKKIFGTFRMGRGQLFAYGKNLWETGKFKMDVDIANMGLDYDLEETSITTAGCKVTIQLYKKINNYDVNKLIEDLQRSLKWLSTRVYVNGREESITTDPKSKPAGFWTHETEEAYVRLEPNEYGYNNVDVYNMGVFVSSMNGKWPHNATVVSKKALTLNFARNEVMTGCPVWNLVKGLVLIERKAKAKPSSGKKKTVPSKTFTPKERDDLAQQLMKGDLDPGEHRHLRLIQSHDGKHWSANMLAEVVKDYRNLLTVSGEKSEKAQKLLANKMAFPVSYATQSRFGATDAKGMAEAIRKLWPTMLHVKGEDLNELWSESYEQVQLIEEKDLTPLERAVAMTIQNAMGELVGKSRKIRFGVTYGPEHWTDGYSYIGLDREWLVRNNVNVRGWFQLGKVVQHELIHDSSSLSKKHKHDDEFYKSFYECYECIVDFATLCFSSFPEYASQCGVTSENANLQEAMEEAQEQSVINELAADLLGESQPADPTLMMAATGLTEEHDETSDANAE